jgi:hypothetical protein
VWVHSTEPLSATQKIDQPGSAPQDWQLAMEESNSPEGVLRARVAIDQVRLSRLATQTAIGRSRASLAETRGLIVALRFAVKSRRARSPELIQGGAAAEAQRLLGALTKVQNENS